MTDYKLDLDYLKRLCKEATPPPWTYDRNFELHCDTAKTHDNTDLMEITYNEYGEGGWPGMSHRSDATFIAESRQAIPALIQEIERLKAQNRRRYTHCSSKASNHRCNCGTGGGKRKGLKENENQK